VEAALETRVDRIEPDSLTLANGNETRSIPNDYVFVFIGGELPTPFLQKLGINIETKFGER
jgi:thioredoxin reductase